MIYAHPLPPAALPLAPSFVSSQGVARSPLYTASSAPGLTMLSQAPYPLSSPPAAMRQVSAHPPPMSLSTISSLSSPSPSRYPDLPVPRTQSLSEFEVEHTMSPKSSHSAVKQPRRRGSDPEHDPKAAYRAAITAVMTSKARPFAVSGRVPMDPSNLTLFFRSQVRRRCCSRTSRAPG